METEGRREESLSDNLNDVRRESCTRMKTYCIESIWCSRAAVERNCRIQCVAVLIRNK